MQPAIAEEIRNLVAGPIDWDFLLPEAADYSVTPLLCRQLLTAAADLVEPSRIQRMNEIMRAHTMRTLVLTAELFTIMSLFRSEGIQAIPYKGPVLAAQAYGDVSLREFEDLDIVLRQRDMAKANEIMTAFGYRPKYPWILSADAAASLVPGEYNYRDEPRRMMVELHTERTLRHFPVPPDLDDLMSRLVSVSVGGHDLLTFSPEDTLLLLCIHGSKDFWERLSWIADVAEFVQACPQLDWDQCLRRAQEWRASRMLHLGLALAIRFFDLQLPAGIRTRVRADSVAQSVATQVERRLVARQCPELSGAARFNFRRYMLEDVFAGWRYSLRLATVPSEDDWSMMRLPNLLAPLYVALRPLRLLCKYGVSDAGTPHGPIASKKASN